MPTDDEFTAALSRVLDGAAELAPEPGFAALAAGARQRGRERRRRHRVLGAAGLAVLVAAGTLGAATAWPPAPAPAPAGPPMTADQLVETVHAMLPDGKLRVQTAGGTGGRKQHGAGTVLWFDDGKGESLLEVQAERTGLRPEQGAVCMDGFLFPQDSCDRTVLPDGSVLVIDKLRSEHTTGGREWRATWAGPGGRRVSVIEYNGQPAQANRDAPPLTSDQLAALVTAPAWNRVFDSLAPVAGAPTGGATPAGSPEPTVTPPSGEVLLPKLVALLPTGATAGAQDPQHRTLVVTAGERRSMLLVSLQPASARGREQLADFGSSLPTPLEKREPQPDGSLVVTNSFGNGKTATDPLLHWTVDVYRPDGAKLHVEEWNGETGYDFRPGVPALDLAALRTIAVSPSWFS